LHGRGKSLRLAFIVKLCVCAVISPGGGGGGCRAGCYIGI
jgi:hypothetical protein